MNTKEQNERKGYQSPAMDVVQLQNTSVLMTSGQVGATLDDVFNEENLICPPMELF